MLHSGTVTDVLTQAVLPHPMLAARWRWNLNRALVVPRSRGGQRRPIHLQRMEADDLLAAAWPALAACQENAGPGPVPVPDHVLVRQTVDDCLTEPLDADGLVHPARRDGGGSGRRPPGRVGRGLPVGPRHPERAALHLPRRRSPRGTADQGRSLGQRPRARSGPNGLPSGLPVDPSELGPLDPGAVAEVLEQVRPRTARCRRAARAPLLPGAVPTGRRLAGMVRTAGGRRAGQCDRGRVGADRTADQGRAVVLSLGDPMVDGDDALAECIGGHLEISGPVTVEQLVAVGRFRPARCSVRR